MKKVIKAGEVIPPFYGVAYRDWATDRAVCYPLFLNVFIRVLRALYVHIATGGIAVRDNPRDAYLQGHADGCAATKKRPLTRAERQNLIYTADHMSWIASRLVQHYGESENVDFVIALRRQADALRELAK